MQNADLIRESLGTIAARIRKRDVSPVEVAEAFLERIAQLNPELNAIVTLAPDVLERAREAEIAGMRGANIGSLHGVPLTIKDTIETAGLLSTSGSKVRMDYVPQVDAPAVARLKAAGAIVLGKSNAAEMAMDYTADNPVFGRTNHPLNHELTPGGSRGGEAVAIATYMSPGGLGSDLAGSVRIPAHFCGICALKPTTGRVPGEGQFPPSTGPSDTKLKGTRFAWYRDDGHVPVTEETANAVATAAAALNDAGLAGEERLPPHADRGNDLRLGVFSRA